MCRQRAREEARSNYQKQQTLDVLVEESSRCSRGARLRRTTSFARQRLSKPAVPCYRMNERRRIGGGGKSCCSQSPMIAERESTTNKTLNIYLFWGELLASARRQKILSRLLVRGKKYFALLSELRCPYPAPPGKLAFFNLRI